MAIVLRWPFSDQIEMPGEKGVSVMGSLMESLVGALAEGCSGVAARPLRGRCAAVARFRPGLALRLAEGRRGLCRAQPATETTAEASKPTARKRAPPKCSIYNSTEHTARSCPSK